MQRVFDLPLSALEARLKAAYGLPAYHAKTIWRAALRHGATEFAHVTSLPKASRAALAGALCLRYATSQHAVSRDGTAKHLVTLPREEAAAAPLTVESVLIPHEHGRRHTLCVSSQAGCSLACTFCATGARGFSANLSAADIVEQVLVCSAQDKKLNVVFMGQGEPLLNLRAVAQAAQVLTSPHGLALPPRRVTVSTSGIAPAIPKLALAAPGVRLALSLHAPDDALRSRLMGINDQYPLAAVFSSLREYVALRLRSVEGGEEGDGEGEEEEEEVVVVGKVGKEPPGQRFNGTRRVRISFEYLLLGGINDSSAQAASLARLLTSWIPHARLHSHVNLIPFNAWAGAPGDYSAPTPGAVEAFQRVLAGEGLSATLRTPRGVDIKGACGQLEQAVKRARFLVKGNVASYAR